MATPSAVTPNPFAPGVGGYGNGGRGFGAFRDSFASTAGSQTPQTPAPPERDGLELARRQLRDATRRCTDFGMTAELLTSLAPSPPPQPQSPRPVKSKRHAPPSPPPPDDPDLDPDADKLLLSKSYFDMKELDRAAYALEACTGKKAKFQRLYYMFLAGERKREEEAGETLGPLDPIKNANKNIPDIESQLAELHANGERDPFLCYLYGVILARHPSPTQRDLAKDLLLTSIRGMPCLWAAWAELASLVAGSTSDFASLLEQLPNHFMALLFKVHLATEYMCFPGEEARVHGWLDELETWFPDSKVIRGFRAMVFYEARDYESAEALYTSLLADQYSLDHFDGFANVLFVMEKRAKLGYLAQTSVGIDKWRRETGVVVGNYHSLRGEHEKAVQHFRRALRLDRNYLAAWTLMGHEFVELKNTGGAVEAYRKAVDINPRDFRAWYGLGQAYEVLKMPYYSLYYYQRAAAIKPNDSRMWTALASAYESLAHHTGPVHAPPNSYCSTPSKSSTEDRILSAIRCYKRALLGNEDVPYALIKLARLYKSIGDPDAAHFYYDLVHRSRTRLGGQGPSSEEFTEACNWLARAAKNRGDYAAAETYAREIEDNEEARGLIRELRSIQAAANGGGVGNGTSRREGAVVS